MTTQALLAGVSPFSVREFEWNEMKERARTEDSSKNGEGGLADFTFTGHARHPNPPDGLDCAPNLSLNFKGGMIIWPWRSVG